MVFPILRDQLGEEAAGYQSMDADTQATLSPRCRHACGFHRMVQLINAGRYPLDEVASGRLCLG